MSHKKRKRERQTQPPPDPRMVVKCFVPAQVLMAGGGAISPLNTPDGKVWLITHSEHREPSGHVGAPGAMISVLIPIQMALSA